MRTMPFRTVHESVTWSDPEAMIGTTPVDLLEPVSGWDYLTPIHISVPFRVDTRSFYHETGFELTADDGRPLAMALVQADCVATSYRGVSQVPLVQGAREHGRIDLEIPAGTCAVEIELSTHVIRWGSTAPTRDPIAHRSGSRLQSNFRVRRIRLEGDGVAFPTEAFSFVAAGLPNGSPWLLRVESERLEEPFLSTVRLFINTDHKRAGEILAAKSLVLTSVLYTDVLTQLILAMAEVETAEWRREFNEGSLGAVAQELSMLYLTIPLASAVQRFRADRGRFLAHVKSSTKFLEQ